jgi:hypothetical protein
MPVDTWTPTRIAVLRRLHAAGCDDREIALALQLPSRAVTGKRQRLGLLSGRNLKDPYEAAVARTARRQRKPER